MLERIEKFAVQFLRSSGIGSACFFGGVEGAESRYFIISTDLGSEFIHFAIDAFWKARMPSVGRVAVPTVLLAGGCAQVAPTIVLSVTVYVIDGVIGPFTCHKRPRENVGKYFLVIKMDSEISVSFGPGCFVEAGGAGELDVPTSSLVAVVRVLFEVAARSPFPEELAGMGVVEDCFLDVLDGREITFTSKESHWLRSDLDQWSGPARCLQHRSGPHHMMRAANEVKPC